MRRITLYLIALQLVALPGPALEREPEEVDLVPRESVSWGLRNVGVGLTAIFGRYNYWYADRFVIIETVPADSRLQLYYLRANFQKLFVNAEAPVRAELPARIQTTEKDHVIVRAAANGFKTKTVTYPSAEVPEKILITLDVLPNSLTFLGLSAIGGRTSLSMHTSKEANFRLLKSKSFPGFTLSLSETGDGRQGAGSISGGLVEVAELSQLGEDLVLRIETDGHDFEVRSKHRYDPIGDEHAYTFDLSREGARAPSFAQVRRQLNRVSFVPGSPCNSRFEVRLREQLDPAGISRALRPSGSIADLYRREAMMRLGRLEKGSVTTLSGEHLRTGNPLELEMALQAAGQVNGYLGLLGAYARGQPNPELVLRSLIAPALPSDEFAPIYAEAEAACKR